MASAQPLADEFRVERRDADGASELRFAGDLRFDSAAALWARLREHALTPGPRWRFDLSELRSLDGGCAALILELADDLRGGGAAVEIVGARGEVQRIVALLQSRQAPDLEDDLQREGFLSQVGRETLALVHEARSILSFVGECARAVRAALRDPAAVHWGSIGRLMERVGADALPIVVLITFLVGLVTAYQAAIQLKQVGANIFVADLVGLSMTRELGPLMTAIIAAGRTGAAFAAELGTMEVGEEVDALYTMGLEPYRFLVLPRVIALVFMLPLLVIVADAVGILGGMCVAVVSLDLTPTAYFTEIRSAVELWDVFSGVIKAVFFALAISAIACQRGLATRGGAEGVGTSTTRAVVADLFFLILIDAFFTVLFDVLER